MYSVSIVSMPSQAKTVSKEEVNLVSPRGHPVVEQEAHGEISVSQILHVPQFPGEVTCPLGYPSRRRMCFTTGQVNPAGAEFDKEKGRQSTATARAPTLTTPSAPTMLARSVPVLGIPGLSDGGEAAG